MKNAAAAAPGRGNASPLVNRKKKEAWRTRIPTMIFLAPFTILFVVFTILPILADSDQKNTVSLADKALTIGHVLIPSLRYCCQADNRLNWQYGPYSLLNSSSSSPLL